MIYRVLDYRPDTGIAVAVEAARCRGDHVPSGFTVNVFSKIPLTKNADYSFCPKDFRKSGVFCRAEIDYTQFK